jgi:hypothetical protein
MLTPAQPCPWGDHVVTDRCGRGSDINHVQMHERFGAGALAGMTAQVCTPTAHTAPAGSGR